MSGRDNRDWYARRYFSEQGNKASDYERFKQSERYPAFTSRLSEQQRLFIETPGTRQGLETLQSAFGIPTEVDFDWLVELGDPYLIREWATTWDYHVTDEHGLRSSHPEVWNMIDTWTLSLTELAAVLVEQRNMKQLHWLANHGELWRLFSNNKAAIVDTGSVARTLRNYNDWPAGADYIEKQFGRSD